MIMPFSLEDLTWQIVERNKVSDLLGVLILNNDCIHNLISWHKVVSKLLLAHLERDLVSLLLLLVEAIHLRDVFGFHHSWGTD